MKTQYKINGFDGNYAIFVDGERLTTNCYSTKSHARRVIEQLKKGWSLAEIEML